MTSAEQDPRGQDRTGTGQGHGGPAASMGLLLELLRDSGDPGYAEAAARREAEHRPAPRGRHTVAAVVSLGLVGLLIAAAAVQTRQAAPAAEARRTELASRIEAATRDSDEMQARVDALAAEVAAAEAAALTRTAAGREAAQRLAVQKAAAQYTPVQGPGAEVLVDDSRDAGKDPEATDVGRVLDRDLQLVVDGLWQAGAEAVTVNGIRLSSRTAIRSAGGAILVDYRPLNPPYRVLAIGDPQALVTGFTDGPAGRALADLRDTYGLRFTVSSKETIDMAAATSALPTVAKPLGGAS